MKFHCNRKTPYYRVKIIFIGPLNYRDLSVESFIYLFIANDNYFKYFKKFRKLMNAFGHKFCCTKENIRFQLNYKKNISIDEMQWECSH